MIHIHDTYFSYEEYDIIGDTAEIDKIIYADGYINIDVGDIEDILSTEVINYVSTGSADGANSLENALKDALSKLPIPIDRINNLLFNIWMPKGESLSDIISMVNYVNELLPVESLVSWGCTFDESLKGHQVKVSLIAASK